MKLTNNIRRILSALLVLVLVFSMLPVSTFAASGDIVDAAIIFSDLHTKKSDYKESTLKNVMTAVKNTGLPVSSVTSAGDAFSVNEDSSSSNGPYTGKTSTLTNAIQSVLGSVPVNYVWSDHDRYAVQADGSTLLDKTSRLVYGAGNDGIYGTDDDGNYYVYSLSMGDLCSYDRYKAGFNTDSTNNRANNGFTATVDQAVANFVADAANLKKDRPLFIASHQPLFDNRNDNAFAEKWFDAINEVATEMDVAFFYGHNHKYDTGSDYYYAKGSTMPVTTTNGWNGYQTGSGYQYTKGDPKSVNKTLNFTHMCAGYLAPSSTGSTSSTTREGTLVAITIYEDSIRYVTYNNKGVFSGNYALDVSVPRDFADAGETVEPTEPSVPETTEPEATKPEATEPTIPDATEPEMPEVTGEGAIWRKATSITNGKKYMLVNYGYNESGVATYAVNKDAGATQIEVLTDSTGAYIVNDDQSLVWTAKSNSTQFEMANAENGQYLRSANYVYNNSASDISVNASTTSGTTYTNWSLETKNGSQVLAVRRAGSSNYYPVRYNSGKFQAFNSSQVGSMKNWLAVFEETDEVAHTHSFTTVTQAATCTQDGSVTTKCTVCGEQTVEVIKALGHDYSCVETAATCSKDGSKVYTCGRCGDTYTETVPATGDHKYESVTIDATCAKDGSVTYTCACGDTYTEVIPATGEHAYESVTVEATCTIAGSTTYTCGVCGKNYSETIPATGKHIYKSETVAATCTQDGSVTYTCGFCGDTYTETISAAGHTYTCTVTEATCTTAGSKVYTCTVCGDTYSEEIPALGHDYQAVVTAPTCTEGGFSTYTCGNCGHSYVADATEALGHCYETATVEATCAQDGSVTYYCVCGDTYSEVIPSTGHSYQAITTAPTCVEAGYTTYTCGSCGDSYVSDNVDALGHSNTTQITDPTCTTGGYTADTCTVCGEYRIYNEVAALGHDYESVTVDPTETEGGYTTHTCTVCGHSYTDNYVDALGHTIVSVVTDPTCTEEGYTTHTCTVCGEVTVDTYVPALGHDHQTVTVDATCTADGSVTKTCARCADTSTEVIGAYGHDYEANVTAPTCTEGGHTVYSCGRCGDNYVSDRTEATGHNYTAIRVDVTCTQDGYTTYLCTNCGDSYVGDTAAALGHDYQTVTADATCTEDGSITHICSRCGDSYSEVIPAAGHDYEAVITEATCTAEGYTTYTCHCGDSYVADKTSATGHNYDCVEENGNQIYTCDSCGDTYTVTIGWVALDGTYVLDTDGLETGAVNKYLVVGADHNQALTLSGSTVGNASVQISGNTITLEDAAKYEFYFQPSGNKLLLTQDGKKTVYHQNANMYYGNNTAGHWTVTNKGSGKYQVLNQDGNGNWSLNYGYVWGNDSSNRFAVSYYERHVRLFKATDSYARLYGTLNQTMVHGADATVDAVLDKVRIQTSADGIAADGNLAVDSSMISWDKAFDGYTAGTYTATVSYKGEKLGTITVNVTGEHTYDSTRKEATCTEAGYTTHTCTVCGHSYSDGNTAALGHSYSSVETADSIVYTCDRCAHTYSESLAKTYTKVTSISGGNNYVITLVSGSKYYAVSHKNNSISAVQVTVSGDQITSEITEDLVWTYSGSKLSYKSGNTTYYLYAQPAGGWWGWWSAPTLTISSSNSTSATFSNNAVQMSGYYLRYASGSLSLNSSATTTNLFIEK